MSRRRRAAALALLAGLAAVLSGSIVDGYGSSIANSYGDLRPVVVAGSGLPAGVPIGPTQLSGSLEVRRIPERFIPPGALAGAAEALGLEPAIDIPAGSYVVGSSLRAPRRRTPAPGLGPGRRPVEINVSGAAALDAAGAAPGSRVDVVVTGEPRAAGPGRTYIAATSVPLIALRPGPDGPGPGTISSATLGLTRAQALELIAAENFARQVTLLPRPRLLSPP